MMFVLGNLAFNLLFCPFEGYEVFHLLRTSERISILQDCMQKPFELATS